MPLAILAALAGASLLVSVSRPEAMAEDAVPAAGPASVVLPGGAADETLGKHLHNCFRLSEHLTCGAQPESDDDFAALAAAGIRVIVSVDGAAPDVAAAKRHGLRYVHAPFGYDGIPASLPSRARSTSTATTASTAAPRPPRSAASSSTT